MGIYTFLVQGYYHLIAPFPAPLQWLLSVGLLIGFVVLCLSLLRANALTLIVLVLLLPVVIPILVRVLTELWGFFLFLLQQVGVAV